MHSGGHRPFVQPERESAGEAFFIGRNMNTNIYFIRTKDNANLIKIGVAQNVKSRLDTLQTGNHSALEIIGSTPIDSHKHALYIEKKIHDLFRYYRVRGEWFRSAAPLRNFITAITRDNMSIADAMAIAITESEKHKVEYYNRTNTARSASI